MLTAIPRNWRTWDFALVDGGKSLAEIDMSSWRERGTLTISNEIYRVYRERLFTGAFVLESNGVVVARATKPSAWTRRLIVEFGGSEYELKSRSSFSRGFRLLKDGALIGTLSPSGIMSRRMNVELTEELPLSLKAFVVWLTVLLWKRAAEAAAGT